MEKTILRTVTILYYDIHSLELNHSVQRFPQAHKGRVIISNDFKKDKSIIAVCDGDVEVLNKIGDRIEG